MKDIVFWKKLIPVLLSSFTAWFYCMVYTPLGYIFNDFPGQDTEVLLIASLPGIIAMVGGFAAAGLMHIMSKKTLVVGSIAISIVGGFIVRFFGANSLTIAIIGSAMTGFAAGSIPAVNYAMLAEIAPEKMRDKVCGWSDAMCTLGILVAIFIGGFLAADGNWARAFNVYYILVPILILVILWYPSVKTAAAETLDKEKDALNDENAPSIENLVPKVIWVIIIVKFLSAFFYMAMSYNVSAYIINELQIGSSALVGTAGSFATLVTAVGSAIVFIWLKIFRSTSTLVAQMFMGVFSLIIVFFPSIPMIIIGWMLLNVGMNTHHSSIGTVVAMAPKGKAVGIVTGLFIGATFVGEALSAYVTPFMSNLLFHSTAPSMNILTGGIFCIIFGLVGFPFFRKAYNLAFPESMAKMAKNVDRD